MTFFLFYLDLESYAKDGYRETVTRNQVLDPLRVFAVYYSTGAGLIANRVEGIAAVFVTSQIGLSLYVNSDGVSDRSPMCHPKSLFPCLRRRNVDDRCLPFSQHPSATQVANLEWTRRVNRFTGEDR